MHYDKDRQNDIWRTLTSDSQRFYYERALDLLYAHFADTGEEPSSVEITENAKGLAYNDYMRVAA